jgi:CxxC-x17-CxxC domain-containing protein
MQLTLDQSLAIYVNRFKEVYASNKYKYTSKFPYTCYNCGATIYVPFENTTRKDIFCEKCKYMHKVQGDKYINPQKRYLNEIKEKQLPIILSSSPDQNVVNLKSMSMLKPHDTAKPMKLIEL